MKTKLELVKQQQYITELGYLNNVFIHFGLSKKDDVNGVKKYNAAIHLKHQHVLPLIEFGNAMMEDYAFSNQDNENIAKTTDYSIPLMEVLGDGKVEKTSYKSIKDGLMYEIHAKTKVHDNNNKPKKVKVYDFNGDEIDMSNQRIAPNEIGRLSIIASLYVIDGVELKFMFGLDAIQLANEFPEFIPFTPKEDRSLIIKKFTSINSTLPNKIQGLGAIVGENNNQ